MRSSFQYIQYIQIFFFFFFGILLCTKELFRFLLKLLLRSEQISNAIEFEKKDVL